MPKRIFITEAELRKMLIDDSLTQKQCGELLGCSKHNIKRLVRKFGIKLKHIKGHQKAWNKGLTKETNECVAKQAAQMIGNKNFGESPWNKGLTKETDERLANAGRKRAGRPMSLESRLKMSKARKARWEHDPEHTGMTGRKQSQLSIESSRERMINRIKFGHIGKSKLHGYIWALLQEELPEGHGFESEVPMGKLFVYDIGSIDKMTFIEIQGDYWHRNPNNERVMAYPITKAQAKNIERDKRKARYIEKRGGKLICIWEKDFTEHPEITIYKTLKQIAC